MHYLAQEIQERVPKLNQGMYRCRFISIKTVNSIRSKKILSKTNFSLESSTFI